MLAYMVSHMACSFFVHCWSLAPLSMRSCVVWILRSMPLSQQHALPPHWALVWVGGGRYPQVELLLGFCHFLAEYSMVSTNHELIPGPPKYAESWTTNMFKSPTNNYLTYLSGRGAASHRDPYGTLGPAVGWGGNLTRSRQ